MKPDIADYLSSLISGLFFKEVERVRSSFNGEIKVTKYRGRYGVWVGGGEQSGEWVEKVWEKGLATLDSHGLVADFRRSRKVLVLGLGAGTVVKILEREISGCRITGVEIDPVMIEMGKKYFGLDSTECLQITQIDAEKFVSRAAKKKEKYDLVLVDLYCGQMFPKQFETEEFLNKLPHILSEKGEVIFNRLTMEKADFELEGFLDKLGKIFRKLEKIQVDFNTLIFCSGG